MAVVPLSVVSVAAFFETVHLSNAFTEHESAACRYMSLPWANYASAYVGLITAVLAVVLYVRAVRARRRGGGGARLGWIGGLAVVCVAFAGLMVLLDGGIVVITHLQGARRRRTSARPSARAEEGCGQQGSGLERTRPRWNRVGFHRGRVIAAAARSGAAVGSLRPSAPPSTGR